MDPDPPRAPAPTSTPRAVNPARSPDLDPRDAQASTACPRPRPHAAPGDPDSARRQTSTARAPPRPRPRTPLQEQGLRHQGVQVRLRHNLLPVGFLFSSVNAPTSQSLLNYILFALVYGGTLLYKRMSGCCFLHSEKCLKATWVNY